MAGGSQYYAEIYGPDSYCSRTLGALVGFTTMNYAILDVYSQDQLLLCNYEPICQFYTITNGRPVYTRDEFTVESHCVAQQELEKFFGQKVFFQPMPSFIFFNTQTMHVKSVFHSSIAMFSLKNLPLWRVSNPGLLFM
jgi:hypothetical protein